ncbi:hypothetical protein E2562_038017 [Oryza meyeriana var. granulata]|uniref:Uncharacterized protein n=1 Tax=Oryza meyeriana var. granulata TaxID=110450 RepID=A0A6G1ECS8_9ORYZ|nr:hypothetical protein E2562_038017 [Oryza meyeriana var. granulata]
MHLDPMLHEASIQATSGCIYSPNMSEPRVVSPIFVPTNLSGLEQNQEGGAQQTDVVEGRRGQPTSPATIHKFIDDVSTPLQLPLLPALGLAKKTVARNKRYQKPLSPSSLKIIAALVEKGGCKNIHIRTGKKGAAVAPA